MKKRNKMAKGILSAKFEKVSIFFVLLAICAITYVFVSDAFSQERDIRRQEPPPEAYEVCEDKSAGDEAELITPRGEKVTDTCKKEEDRLVQLLSEHISLQ